MTTEDTATDSQIINSNARPAASRKKWFIAASLGGVILGGCGLIVLLALICTGTGFFAIWGGGGDPANIPTAEKVTRAFVLALHDGDVQSAHQMLVAETRAKQSVAQLASFRETDPIKKYQSLQVCEFGLFFTEAGRMLAAKGILYYEGGAIVFESDLRQDLDSVWRVHGFYLQPDIDPKPWGACQ